MEPPASAQVLPPGVEPLPRQEEAVGRTRGEEFIPLLPEIRKGQRILDTLDVVLLEVSHGSRRPCSGFTASRVTWSSSMPPIRYQRNRSPKVWCRSRNHCTARPHTRNGHGQN